MVRVWARGQAREGGIYGRLIRAKGGDESFLLQEKCRGLIPPVRLPSVNVVGAGIPKAPGPPEPASGSGGCPTLFQAVEMHRVGGEEILEGPVRHFQLAGFLEDPGLGGGSVFQGECGGGGFRC